VIDFQGMARGNALGANMIDLPIDTSSPETMLTSLDGTARRLAVECERNAHVTFSLSPKNALLLARALENQRNEARHDIEIATEVFDFAFWWAWMVVGWRLVAWFCGLDMSGFPNGVVWGFFLGAATMVARHFYAFGKAALKLSWRKQ